MHIQALAVNHGTTRYMELMLASLIAHHRDRSGLDVLVLDNESGDLAGLDWLVRPGIAIQPSGYPRQVPINTHGEILRDAVLARPDCDAYLFLDADVCFISDDTIPAMARELASDPGLFAVQATWSIAGDDEFEVPAIWRNHELFVRDSFKFQADEPWPPLREYVVRLTDRIWPFCTLVRNDDVFRRIVRSVGLSAANNQCLRGGRQWDTFGLLTSVMETHDRRWRRSARRVIHFGAVSYSDELAEQKARGRDELLERYRPSLRD